MSLRIRQDHTYVGDDWWKWSVWLAGSTEELAAVARVVYTLHPSFVPAVHTVKTRKNGFRLKSEGWGMFTMHLDIVFRDKTVSKRKCALKLRYPAAPANKTAQEKSVRPLVYLSSTAGDADTASAINSSLASQGIEVVGNDDWGSGMPVSRAVESTLAKSQHAIFVMSSRPSLWMNREMDAARRHHVPITAVLVGENSKVPESIADITPLRLTDASQVATLFEGKWPPLARMKPPISATSEERKSGKPETERAAAKKAR